MQEKLPEGVVMDSDKVQGVRDGRAQVLVRTSAQLCRERRGSRQRADLPAFPEFNVRRLPTSVLGILFSADLALCIYSILQ